MKLSSFDARLFVAVADLGGFSAAARALDLQKSWVSRELAELEQRLGTRLLHRTTRQVSLTEAGARLLPHARRVVAALDEAEAEMESLSGQPRGQLRVTMPYAFARFVLAESMADFRRAYPEVRLHIDTSNQVADMVHGGFDVAIRIGELPPSTLVARLLARVPMVLAASAAYAASQALPTDGSALAAHPLIGLGQGLEQGSWVLHDPQGQVTEVPVSLHMVVADPGLAIDLARSGTGIAMVPLLYAGPLFTQGVLRPVLLGWTLGQRNVQFVFPSRKLLTPKVKAFMDFIGDRVATQLKV